MAIDRNRWYLDLSVVRHNVTRSALVVVGGATSC
jgi:hypothetical protein